MWLRAPTEWSVSLSRKGLNVLETNPGPLPIKPVSNNIVPSGESEGGSDGGGGCDDDDNDDDDDDDDDGDEDLGGGDDDDLGGGEDGTGCGCGETSGTWSGESACFEAWRGTQTDSAWLSKKMREKNEKMRSD